MIEQYLKKRQKIVVEDLTKYKEEFEHNQIAMVEAKNKIIELENSEDVATKIFSVRTREKEVYKSQEIRDLESRITIYVTENIQNKKMIASCENELKTIEECITEFENVSRETSDNVTQMTFDTSLDNNVSRETSDVKQMENIVKRLELCKNLVNIDGNRVNMELEMLIKELKTLN
jgi:leucyl aminopeptidase